MLDKEGNVVGESNPEQFYKYCKGLFRDKRELIRKKRERKREKEKERKKRRQGANKSVRVIGRKGRGPRTESRRRDYRGHGGRSNFSRREQQRRGGYGDNIRRQRRETIEERQRRKGQKSEDSGRTEEAAPARSQKACGSWGRYEPDNPNFRPREIHPSWKQQEEEMVKQWEDYKQGVKQKSSKTSTVLSLPDGCDDSESDDTAESRSAARRRMNNASFQ